VDVCSESGRPVGTRASSAPRIWIGTSGYNYPEWKGTFYPERLAPAKMLPYYAARLPTVEINYTFYRMPTERLLAGWAAQTPETFRFTLKAPRRITHDARLRACEEITQAFCGTSRRLGERLGVLLFQLPPSLRRDLPLLQSFLDTLPPATRAAFEFRHGSWHDDAVVQLLSDRRLALCVADSDRTSTPVAVTADYAYFRLRDEGYEEADIGRWAETIVAATVACRDVFVYFKHEERGKGPEFARRMIERLKA
jgi:uncharacterized protein YecE (DUF72 family)